MTVADQNVVSTATMRLYMWVAFLFGVFGGLVLGLVIGVAI